jgi:hypothetical protein
VPNIILLKQAMNGIWLTSVCVRMQSRLVGYARISSDKKMILFVFWFVTGRCFAAFRTTKVRSEVYQAGGELYLFLGLFKRGFST